MRKLINWSVFGIAVIAFICLFNGHIAIGAVASLISLIGLFMAGIE